MLGGERSLECEELALDGHVDLDAESLRIAKLLYEARRRRYVSLTSRGLKLTTSLLDAIGSLN